MSPITDCIRDGMFVGTHAADQEFQTIKEKLCTNLISALPNFNDVFEVHTDTSKSRIGMFQSQKNRPIAFFREKLSNTRFHYSTYDVEFYDIVHAIRHWRHYLFHREFVLYTDHDALKHLSTRHGLPIFNSSHSSSNTLLARPTSC